LSLCTGELYHGGCRYEAGVLAALLQHDAAERERRLGAPAGEGSIDAMGRSPEAARSFLEAAPFVWYQRFQLAPGVYTPGERDVEQVLAMCGIPDDLTGLSVLDVGTTNGGFCFELERRGARRVVAVDILPPEHFGFEELRGFLRSRVEFVQARIYELPALLSERFDIVLFLGVLYHLRHPLLALDSLRSLTAGEALIETEVADNELGSIARHPVSRFYRFGERAGDSTNWFAPTIACLLDWCASCGFEAELLTAWPAERPQRCLVRARLGPDPPEYLRISYERPVLVQAELGI
jgi:tRNA (mo5U34)-methyltransferase